MADQNTDSTSFASILAGVSKLRQDAGGSASTQPTNQAPLAPSSSPQQYQQRQRQQQNYEQRQHQQKRPANTADTHGQKRVNAFNQDKSRSTTPTARTIKASPILVNKTQEGNKLLADIKNVNWNYVEKHNPYDYLVNGRNVIFLSLKYHKLRPEYLPNRLKALAKRSAVLLVVNDVPNSETILREVNKMALFNEYTLLLAFSFEEAAKYLTFMAMTPTKIRKGPAPDF